MRKVRSDYSLGTFAAANDAEVIEYGHLPIGISH